VSITADQERGFYDGVYSQYLNVPDSALVCNRQTLEADLANPARAIYERRRLYGTVLKVLLAESVTGRRVLDYGCGTGDWGLMLAGEGADVTLLDLSPVAIELALRRASVSGVSERVQGIARDASDLSCFREAQFDLIYASAAVHHTLKYPHALDELLRVLRPGGKLVLAETYGNNPILNSFRRLRWKSSKQPDEAGEEILFNDAHVDLLRARLTEVTLMPLSLLAIAKRLFRDRFVSGPVRSIVALLELADAVLLKACPPLRRYCGELVVLARK
jgi:ubiquinone/menaquinone biosynthesis C-methylase UbiE